MKRFIELKHVGPRAHVRALVDDLIDRLEEKLRHFRDDTMSVHVVFEENAAHMRYGEFRKKKLFVGSGVVEAGCRAVIGQRLKLSGMRWSVRGANAIIALRCCLMSGRFEDFWASRTG